MSAKQNRASRRGRPERPAHASATVARSGGKSRVVWIALLVILFASGAGVLLLQRARVPSLPEISTAQLDPTSAGLVENHIAAVRAAPRSAAAWGKLGAILKSFELREEARRCFGVAEKLDSHDPRWPYLHGVMVAFDSPQESIVLLQRAVALCGNEPDAPRMRLARMLAEAGRWDEARVQLQELLRAKPDHAPALLALANAAQARGDFAEAMTFANRCTADPRTARAAW